VAIVAKIATVVSTFSSRTWYSRTSCSWSSSPTLHGHHLDPKSIAENIQKQGGYVPGIRPGPSTAQFLNHLLNRVTLVGAVFLGLIAILPNVVQGITGITAFTVGGTSILIVVSVALEVMKQIQAQLSLYDY
jgi:preprotein translocase subunit SecY